MRVALSVVRPFHATLMANAALRLGHQVSLATSAPRRFFAGLDPEVTIKLVPAPLHLLDRFLPFPRNWKRHDLALWDSIVAAFLPDADVVIGFATQSLATARKARSRGTRFLLDRACPHVDTQQAIVRAETEKVGGTYAPEPAWFRERQLEEYELADAILVPSNYTASSFPASQQAKLVIAPLLGRAISSPQPAPPSNPVFTVGVLGGNPVRKGYLYLLEAWQQLALPNARLLIRNAGLDLYPKLAQLLSSMPNVELVPYVADIADFYRSCDVFILPSVDDGFGMALCEAMAHGIACIATQNCGASELMTHGIDGLIVPAANSEALAEALLHLYQHPGLRQSIAAAGAATITRVAREARYEAALQLALTQSPESTS